MTARGGIVDYSARDRDEILTLMMRELRSRLPEWQPGSIADIGVTLVELLAAEADRLAYAQDAVGTEAYIGTARQRRSVARHARLLGVRVKNGCNARTLVHVSIDGDEVDLPCGTQISAVAPAHESDDPPLVFETMHRAVLRQSCNEIRLHGDRERPTTLGAGATRATLCGHVDVRPRDLLAFTDPADRLETLVVRVVEVRQAIDHGSRHPITEVEWAHADALSSDLTFGVSADGDRCRSSTVVRGNLVLADHGETRKEDETSPRALVVRDSATGAHWRLAVDNLVFTEPFDAEIAAGRPAKALLTQDPAAALPALQLTERDVPGAVWTPTSDLIGCHRFQRRFVVELSDGDAAVRFGDGVDGRSPGGGVHFDATVRIGGGPMGNIAPGVLNHIITDDPRLATAQAVNVVPAVGGQRPETIEELRRRAPHAWQQLDACIAPADYAERAEEHPDIRSAFARWAGPPGAVDLFVLSSSSVPPKALLDDVRQLIEPRRTVGHTLKVQGPEVVDLAVEIRVSGVRPADRSAVELALKEALGSGATGLFAPRRVELGKSVHASEIVSVAAKIDGVHSVVVDRLGRADVALPDLTPSSFAVEPWQVAILSGPSIEIGFVDEW